MKIKEAMQLLEAFKGIAGEDTEVEIEQLRLIGSAEREYHAVGYGIDRYTTKVGYRVTAKLAAVDPVTLPGQFA